MVQRPPTADAPILHFLEDVFDEELTAIPQDDFFLRPFVTVGHQDVLAQVGIRESVQRCRGHLIVQPWQAAFIDLRSCTVPGLSNAGDLTANYHFT